jgi:hypothetical protein
MPANTTLPGSYGSLTALDTLAAQYQFQTVAQVDETRVWEALSMLLAAHNRILTEMRQSFIASTSERLFAFSVPQLMQMDELGEHDVPDASKIAPGYPVGFPLRKYGEALQWTRTYFLRMKMGEFAAQVNGLVDADYRNVILQVKRALFNSVNYTFIDKLVDVLRRIPLPVVCLANADGQGLPPGPNGEIFDPSTHQHYMGATTANSPTDADMTTHLNNVLEHWSSGQAYFYINQADEASVRGFTPNFQQAYDTTLHVGENITYAKGALDVVQIYNRKIGTYRGAEVWVKPWIPVNYRVCWIDVPQKPLMWRYDPDMPQDLAIAFEDEAYPLRARGYERVFGLGVWGRVSAAIMDLAHTSYNIPTLTA